MLRKPKLFDEKKCVFKGDTIGVEQNVRCNSKPLFLFILNLIAGQHKIKDH